MFTGDATNTTVVAANVGTAATSGILHGDRRQVD